MNFPEEYRIQPEGFASKAGEPFGLFFIFHGPLGRPLKIIANGASEESAGWEHVSVSIVGDKRRPCPSWVEMAFVKGLFWNAEDCVVEFHVPATDHVNVHEGCLHLWRNPTAEFPRPPQILV
jgi:hypothetical protein